jgi:Glycosyl hydrolase family 99
MRHFAAPLALVLLAGFLAARFAAVGGAKPPCPHHRCITGTSNTTTGTTSTTGTSTTVPTTSTTSTTTPTTTTTPPTLANITLPIRGTFYYPWYPETWYSDQHNHPALGDYDTSSLALIDAHLNEMAQAKIGLAIASWWGQGTKTDSRISTLLDETTTHGSAVKWGLYYEQEAYSNPTVSQIQSDLTYINTKYGQNQAFARINGKPIIFVYAGATDGCASSTDMTQRWHQANANLGDKDYVVLKVFNGYATCPDQPANWHQYAPGSRSGQHGTHSFYVSPGFWLHSDTTPRLVRNPAAFALAVQAMTAANVDFKLVETFNEWGEDTSIENANSTEWGNCYISILHNDGLGALPASCA